MIVYNTTIKIDFEIEKEWLQWQKHVHIPDVMATGIFTEHKFFRLIEEDQTDGITYVIQYFTDSFRHYKKYIDEFLPSIHKKAFAKWGNQCINFSSVMEIVN